MLDAADERSRTMDGYVNTSLGHIALAVGPYVYGQLRSFFEPYYTFSETRPATMLLGTISGQVNDAVKADGGPSLDMDDYLGSFPLSAVRDGVETYQRPTTGIILRFKRPERCLAVIAACRLSLELQVRVLLRDQFLQAIDWMNGSFMVHAAAVEKNGSAIAFLGERGCGKTTSLLAAMRDLQCNFLTADRLKLSIRNGLLQACGVPARCNVHTRAFAAGEILEPLAHLLNDSAIFNGKTLLPVRALTSQFNVGIAPTAALKIVVLPELTTDRNAPVQCETVLPDGLPELLRRNQLGRADTDRHRPWLRCFDPVGQSDPLTGSEPLLTPPLILRCVGGIATYQRWVPQLQEYLRGQ